MMEWLFDGQIWASFLTLFALEVILGIDNVVIISVLSGKLPEAKQASARRWGIMMALATRIGLLSIIAWLAGLVKPLVTLFGFALSARDIIMLLGGLFLIYKGTLEMHHMVDHDEEGKSVSAKETMLTVVAQIAMFDMVFSLDSVMTAVGIGHNLAVMIAAVVASMVVMLTMAEAIAAFIARHLSVKMLALSFLLLIGVTLVAEGMHFHIPKAYIYFAIGFSGFVEVMTIIAQNARTRRAAKEA